MRRIRANDCRTLPFSAEQVREAVLDFDNYHRWWPRKLRMQVLRNTPNHLGSQIEVRPTGGWFVCEIAAVAEQQIVIDYVAGLHRGRGVWSFEKTAEGVRVCYEIDLEPQGWLPRLLSHVMDFGRMHSNQMEQVFDGLERWLSDSEPR